MKKAVQGKFTKMNGEWQEDSQLHKAIKGFDHLNLAPETLTLLREKRLRSAALSRIDNHCFGS